MKFEMKFKYDITVEIGYPRIASSLYIACGMIRTNDSVALEIKLSAITPEVASSYLLGSYTWISK